MMYKWGGGAAYFACPLLHLIQLFHHMDLGLKSCKQHMMHDLQTDNIGIGLGFGLEQWV